MNEIEEFLAETRKQQQRFFPEAPLVYLDELPFYVKARVVLHENYFVELRFNARNGRKSYALVRGGRRIAGFDSLVGWHIHPFGKPETHTRISEPSLADAFRYFSRGI